MRIIGRVGFYLKNALVVERLSKIEDIVFDKTGTITSAHSNGLLFVGEELNPFQKSLVKSLTYQTSHPASKQIFNQLKDLSKHEVKEFKESVGMGVSGIVEGHKVRLGSKNFIKPDAAAEGVLLEIDFEYKGYFSLSGSYRTGLEETIGALKKDYNIRLLTGDNEKEKETLKEIFGEEVKLYFKQSPQKKLQYVKSLQNKGREVMMIGDGLNDAGALQQSDIGMAITEDTSNFSPASDIISLGSGFMRIPDLMVFAKKSVFLLYIAYVISFLYNIIGLSFAIQATLSPVIAAILMPLSSITTVVFGILGTNIIARKLLRPSPNSNE